MQSFSLLNKRVGGQGGGEYQRYFPRKFGKKSFFVYINLIGLFTSCDPKLVSLIDPS